ncbi:hypothetical protein [Embleya sp. NPDC005575]|uniref:hypothetical protein n=1 Tax=Embleya sp. NPDC005575 TaxID=3156892 RepID=UPI0033A94FB1
MSDLYELTMDLALRAGRLSGPDVAELRWHVGLAAGAIPDVGDRRIVTEFPVVVVDDLGVPAVVDDPHPVLGADGIALRIGGESATGLAPIGGGWALTVRRELHPDQFDEVGELLAWLAARAEDAHTDSHGSVVLGWLRFIEDTEARPLVFRDGRVQWPDREAG